MLPGISRMNTTISRRAAFILTVCATGLLALPTFHGVAQSQEAKQRPGTKQSTIQSSPSTQQQPGKSTLKLPGKGDPAADSPIGVRSPDVGPPAVEYLPRPTANEQRIVAALEEKTSFHFEEVPLDQAMKQIAMHHNINIVLLMDGQAAKETRVSLHVAEVSLKNALKLMLQLPMLSYVAADEVLKIVPREELDAHRFTRIYPVQDLVGQSEDFESLILAIQQSVARGTWTVTQTFGQGGNPIHPAATGGISKVPASGSLVIHHNLQVHEEVLQLLRGLREAKSIPAVK